MSDNMGDIKERVKKGRKASGFNAEEQRVIDEYEEKRNTPTLQFYWAETPEKLLKDPKISLAAKGLYGLIYTYCYNKKYDPNTDKLSRGTLARFAGVTVKTITKLENELIEGGWMIMKHRGLSKPNKINLLQVKKRT